MLAILPQDGIENIFGSFALANAESHTTDDLNAPMYELSSGEPPVGSGAIFPSSIWPTVTLLPSYTTTCASHLVSVPTCMSFSTHISMVNSAHSL